MDTPESIDVDYQDIQIQAKVMSNSVILQRAVRKNIRVSTKEFCILQNDKDLIDYILSKLR